MAKDPAHFLNDLPIWKLKAVAEAFDIDVSTCRYKRDYVQKVQAKKLTEEQVRAVLADKGKRTPAADEGRPEDVASAEVKAVARDIEQIASRPVEASELPVDEEKNVERNLDESLTLKPSFFEVDSAFQSAYNRMILGDFYGAIKINRETRILCLGTFSNAQVFSAAMSIRAAEELLARLTEGHHPAGPALKTALAEAKRSFLSGPPRQREEALESLESLVEKSYEAFVGESETVENELKALLADYESFGTRTDEARRYLDIAGQAKSSFNMGDYSKYLEEARARAESAKAARAREIDEGFSLVRAGAEEAREAGAEVPEVDERIDQAKQAYDDGAFKRAIDLLSSVEKSVDEAHLARLKEQKDLEAKHVAKVNEIVGSYEPMLLEASSYGMGVQEGLYHAANAKAALGNRDIIRAVKHARRLKEVATPLEKDLDAKRLELGVVRHLEGVKCSACGQESIYAHPNGTRKCFECGQSFQAPVLESPVQVAPAPQPKPEPTPPPQMPETAPGKAVIPSTPVKSRTQPEPEKKKRKGFFKW